MSRREIFENGILGYAFQDVVSVLGQDEAVRWAEFCASFTDHHAGGNTYPLTGFSLQKTYAEWKNTSAP
jgi:hypothetical protein